MRGVAVLGSTGSVGAGAIDVIRAHPDRFRLLAIAARSRWELLAAQIEEFHPEVCVLVDPTHFRELSSRVGPFGVEVRTGAEALADLAGHAGVDCVLSAVTGAPGLPAAVETVRRGKRLALANKESLVMAGPLLVQLAEETGAEILPVDSEHSAIFQALHCGAKDEVRRLVLTASGGPFRGWPSSRLETVTPDEALRHPTWRMGKKISIDSATMMNKALEIVEARWLFGITRERIDVVVHPQSIVHSMVEFRDGSVIAQLGEPDMRVPIQFAMSYPERLERETTGFDVRSMAQLTFEPPDPVAFPALRLGFEVAERGGTLGSVLNAANEVAVDRFLSGKIPFPAIAEITEAVLRQHRVVEVDRLETVIEADREARRQAERLCSGCSSPR